MSRKLCLPLALLAFSALPCFAQQTAQQTATVGYAACPAGEGYVYLYRSPSDFTVLANLKCGARIEVLGSVEGYVVARTADGKQGYILLSAVTTNVAPAMPAQVASFVSTPQPPARAATSSPFFGNVGRAEISAGYSYLSMDLSGLGGLPRGNGNGFQSSVTVNLNRLLAGEGVVDGYFKNNPLSVANFYDYTLMAGPRVSIRPFFVHALFGVDLLTASVSGSPTFSQNSVAGALGGGAQWKLRPLWSVYTSVDYVVALHSLPGNTATTQNNVRVSAGIVFHIGGGFGGIRN